MTLRQFWDRYVQGDEANYDDWMDDMTAFLEDSRVCILHDLAGGGAHYREADIRPIHESFTD